jgi:hypothetical protein
MSFYCECELYAKLGWAGLFSTAFQQPILNWVGPFTNPTGAGLGLSFYPNIFHFGSDFSSTRPIVIPVQHIIIMISIAKGTLSLKKNLVTQSTFSHVGTAIPM